MLLIGRKVFEFKVIVFKKGEKDFVIVIDKDLLGKWLVFVFYLVDFIFVCFIELEDLQDNYEVFKKEGVEVYLVFCDIVFVYKVWVDYLERIKKVIYLMVVDFIGFLVRVFEVMIEEEGLVLRGSFVINLEGKIVVYEVYDNGIGREVKELLRKF